MLCSLYFIVNIWFLADREIWVEPTFLGGSVNTVISTEFFSVCCEKVEVLGSVVNICTNFMQRMKRTRNYHFLLSFNLQFLVRLKRS